MIISCYRRDQQSDTKDSVTDEIDKCVESDHSSSGNDPDTVDERQQPDSTLTRVDSTVCIGHCFVLWYLQLFTIALMALYICECV
jgi:hypothetical protein